MRKQREKMFFAQRGTIVRVLFYLNAVFWLILSLNTLASMVVDGNQGFPVALVAFFLLVTMLSLFFGGRLLDQNEKWTYIFALVVVLLNTALSFTGVPDILYLIPFVIDVIILIMLISLRNIYFK